MKSDIIALLEKSRLLQPGPASLPVVSIWQPGTHFVMFFTLVSEIFSSHFEESGKRSYQCLGDDCPACAVGIKATEHVYLPVWDPQARRIAVLKFHTGETGPAPTILEFIKIYKSKLTDIIAIIKCTGNGSLTITAHDPTPETDKGALACEAFCRGLDAGTVDLRACVRQLSADEIMSLPSVKCRGAVLIGKPCLPPNTTPVVAGSVAAANAQEGA